MPEFALFANVENPFNDSARALREAGVRVLDLSSVIFGPMSSQVLADYGAEVIKIEPPSGDSTRHTGPAVEKGMAAMFLGSNRSKKSVVLDLKQPSAQEALQALLRQTGEGPGIQATLDEAGKRERKAGTPSRPGSHKATPEDEA